MPQSKFIIPVVVLQIIESDGSVVYKACSSYNSSILLRTNPDDAIIDLHTQLKKMTYSSLSFELDTQADSLASDSLESERFWRREIDNISIFCCTTVTVVCR
jgi:hypothetical protein